jgi:hypothetical protein
MSRFVAQVKGATAIGRTDINRVSEQILIPLFSEIYGYTDLRNLNYTDSANYPGIDLGDESAEVAFQITSTASSEKVKDTLKKFVEYGLYRTYRHLIIYILTEKQRSYSGRGYKEIIKERFSFDKSIDIQDYRDVLRKISSLPIEKTRRIEDILEAHFGEGRAPLFTPLSIPRTETIYLNLLELFFPDTIYLAYLNINRDETVKNSKDYRIRLWQRSPTRDVVRAALEQMGLAFGVDWVDHEGKIVTFHNLDDDLLPLSKVIDKGTVTPLKTKEFYEVDENHDRVFKSLLGRCLQQKLYHRNVNWQNQDKLFIFSDLDGEEIRREQWPGCRGKGRKVEERVMKANKPGEIVQCKHLAFRTQYKCIGEQWYIMIKPDWFFSFDGYRKSYYSADSADWLKRKERNAHIFNHLKFIGHFLRYQEESDLFVERREYPFLVFGKLVSFDFAPELNDKVWALRESKNAQQKLRDSQQIPLF